MDELAAEVADGPREQSPGVTQINAAVNQMDKVTRSNAASAEESVAAAEELKAPAATMKSSVAQLLALVGGAAGSAARTVAAAAALPTTWRSGFEPGSNGRANGATLAVPAWSALPRADDFNRF